jgi:hypothetical protein
MESQGVDMGALVFLIAFFVTFLITKQWRWRK